MYSTVQIPRTLPSDRQRPDRKTERYGLPTKTFSK
jgi:hypothetical protein